MLVITETSLMVKTLIEKNTCYLNCLEMKILVHKKDKLLVSMLHYLSACMFNEIER